MNLPTESNVLVTGQGDKIRKREDWAKWLLPPSHYESTASAPKEKDPNLGQNPSTSNAHDSPVLSERLKGVTANTTDLDVVNDAEQGLGRHETSTPIITNNTMDKADVKKDPTKVSGTRDVKVTCMNDTNIIRNCLMLILYFILIVAREIRKH
jgi:hypothetical protein